MRQIPSGFKHTWTYYLRTLPDIDELLEPLERPIRDAIIPSIMGHTCTTSERELLALPVRKGGLRLENQQTSLFRSNLAENDVCPLCNLERQSLSHMLFSCTVSSSWWNLFTRWWQKTFGHHITLTETIILYGWHQETGSNTWIALNYSLIIAKYHIFATSVRDGILSFENFLFRLKDKLSILHAIATKNNKLDKFKETWSALL